MAEVSQMRVAVWGRKVKEVSKSGRTGAGRDVLCRGSSSGGTRVGARTRAGKDVGAPRGAGVSTAGRDAGGPRATFPVYEKPRLHETDL